MDYKRREDNYDEYKSYSNSILKPQELLSDGPVQGYEAPKQEEQEKSAPVETMRLKNPDGMFSVGVNKDKEVTMAVTSDAPGPLLRGDRSVVSMEGAKRLREVPDKIYVNSHDEKVSGIVYKEDLAKSPTAMVKTLKDALEDRESAVSNAVTPFLDIKQDKEAKKEIEDYLRGKLEQRQNSDEDYAFMKAELDRLNKRTALKELEEKRLIHNLTSVTEKMRAKADKLDADYRRIYIENFGLSAEEGQKEDTEGDNDGGSEDNNVEDSKGINEEDIEDDAEGDNEDDSEGDSEEDAEETDKGSEKDESKGNHK